MDLRHPVQSLTWALMRASEDHHRQSGANTAAVHGLVGDSGVAIGLRQSKYLNNLIEQDHRSIKRIVRRMLGSKDINCARRLIAGIETMHMVKKRQLDCPKSQALSAADQFYSRTI